VGSPRVESKAKEENVPKTTKEGALAVRKPRSAKRQPTHEEVALRAYEIYLERGSTPGNAFEDWTQAERELLDKAPKPRRKAAPKSKAA
jgi:DUF2934 family protein